MKLLFAKSDARFARLFDEYASGRLTGVPFLAFEESSGRRGVIAAELAPATSMGSNEYFPALHAVFLAILQTQISNATCKERASTIIESTKRDAIYRLWCGGWRPEPAERGLNDGLVRRLRAGMESKVRGTVVPYDPKLVRFRDAPEIFAETKCFKNKTLPGGFVDFSIYFNPESWCVSEFQLNAFLPLQSLPLIESCRSSMALARCFEKKQFSEHNLVSFTYTPPFFNGVGAQVLAAETRLALGPYYLASDPPFVFSTSLIEYER